MKSAWFAAAIFGFAGLASAQTLVVVEFPNAQNTPINDFDPAGTNSYRLDYIPASTGSNLLSWTTYTGATGGVSYAPGGSSTWEVTIIADAGFEVLLDGFHFVRSGVPNTTITITAATNSKVINTAAPTDPGGGGVGWSSSGTGPTFTRDYADADRPRGTSIILSAPRNGGDFVFDDYSFTFQAIPEPTVLAPMALAGAGLFIRRRRA